MPASDEVKAASPEDDAVARIVAVGASAGGLEPLEQFFEALPRRHSAAFVVVQHLSPDFRSMMPELLKRHSDLTIKVIHDNMPVEVGVIYLAPPRSSLRLEGDHFEIVFNENAYEFSLPINDFFESLASQRREQAFGVVLSGTGSDGTLGAISIQAAGGVVLAQSPESAKFESMPRSVIDACPNALVGTPKQLAAAVTDILDGKRPNPENGVDLAEDTTAEQQIIRLLQLRFGLDFGYYKTSTVGRRMERRMKLQRCDDLEDYVTILARDAEELEALYADLLIGVTTFFRDREAFDLVAKEVLPRLDAKIRDGDEVRVWVPGCASGEEAYSLAILLTERARTLGVRLRAKIFATDIHPRSLAIASRGAYTREQLTNVPKELKERYFTVAGDDFQVSKPLRDAVVFSKHNLIRDPPFTRMDLVSCRNLLIYLEEEAQRKSIAMFHFALRADGHLLLGPSETLGELSAEFVSLSPRWRLFRKKRDVRLPEAARLLPISSSMNRANRAATGAAAAAKRSDDLRIVSLGKGLPGRSLFQIYDSVMSRTVGSAILVNREGEVLHVFADAGRFLGFRSGQFTSSIVGLIDDQLRNAVRFGLERMRNAQNQEFSRTVAFKDPATGEEASVSVTVCVVDVGGPIDQSPLLIALSLLPREAPAGAAGADVAPEQPEDEDASAMRARIRDLERDLGFAEESLQTTTQELETSNEKLQATNEELQATNEELTASNEELQTVNEELHAVNEELYTVSSEHQSKISELIDLTSDLDNLLQSTEIGVLFLDRDLNIRTITPAVAQTFNILSRDIGRPIGHVTSRFDFPDLEAVVTKVEQTGEPVERNIEAAGRDFLLRVLPYRRGNAIDGAVLTFVDITDIARANRSLTQFADIVSHDLKAPLRAIRTSGEWIIEDLEGEPSEELQTHVTRLSEHTERLSQMLSDLRDFSSLQPLKHRVETISTRDLLNDISGLFSEQQLDLRLAENLPELNASEAAMRLVFQNIVDNAVKHSETGKVTLQVSSETADGRVLIEFADDGPGIDPRHHDKVFLPFRKVKSREHAPGSGIGLALVKKTVEDMGGSITLASDPSERPGASFVVSLPADLLA
ncbi:MAG: CheR family methyltransferase [Pseudomonadota bacterium]